MGRSERVREGRGRAALVCIFRSENGCVPYVGLWRSIYMCVFGGWREVSLCF